MKDAFDVLLFDNDGILVDTEPLFLQATQELLATAGIVLDGDFYRDVVLRQGQSVFVLAEEKGYSKKEILELRDLRDRRYAELINAGVQTLSGVRETLASLQGVFPMAIVTSSGRDHFEMIHRQTSLLPFFDFVLADGDYARHKPHPDPYLDAAARFGVEPNRCLVIEDTERGLDAAHAAGMRCLAIPTALSAPSNFGKAERVLDSMPEMLDFLGLGL